MKNLVQLLLFSLLMYSVSITAASLELHSGTGVNDTDDGQLLIKAYPFSGTQAKNIEVGIWRYHERSDAKTTTTTIVDHEGVSRSFTENSFDNFQAYATMIGYRFGFLNEQIGISTGLAYISKTSRNVDEGVAGYASVSAQTKLLGSSCLRASVGYQHASRLTGSDKGISGVFVGLKIPLGRCKS